MPFVYPVVANAIELAAMLAVPGPEGPIDTIQIERSATGGGIGYANIGDVTMVSPDLSYSFFDAAGDLGDWYRWYFSNAANTFPTAGNRLYSGEVQWGTQLNPDYATLAELRSFARILDATDVDDDVQLSLAITAASRAVDRCTDRQFGVLAVAAARYFTPGWDNIHQRYVARIDDLMTTDDLVVKLDLTGTGAYGTTVTDYRLYPLNAPGDKSPWTQIVLGSGIATSTRPGTLEMTAKWGWTAIPSTVKQATLIQASRFYKRRDSPFGVAGSPDMGNELRLLAKMDPDVAVMLTGYHAGPLVR